MKSWTVWLKAGGFDLTVLWGELASVKILRQIGLLMAIEEETLRLQIERRSHIHAHIQDLEWALKSNPMAKHIVVALREELGM